MPSWRPASSATEDCPSNVRSTADLSRSRTPIPAPLGDHHHPRSADLQGMVARPRRRPAETLGVYDPVTADRERARGGRTRSICSAAPWQRSGPGEVRRRPRIRRSHEALRYLARTPSAPASVQMEDAAGEMTRPTCRGSTRAPNWRRRMSARRRDLVASAAPRPDRPAITLEGRDAEKPQAPGRPAAPRRPTGSVPQGFRVETRHALHLPGEARISHALFVPDPGRPAG